LIALPVDRLSRIKEALPAPGIAPLLEFLPVAKDATQAQCLAEQNAQFIL
jgi:hypothetical protein